MIEPLEQQTAGVACLHLKCLNCASELRLLTESVFCPACKSSAKIRRGIPRFFVDAKYWGEITHEKAQELVEHSRLRGWRQAVEEDLADSPEDLIPYITDWQRASWLSLLGLGADAVALDVGCGWGAITHALAKACKQAYAVDAIAERVEFTHQRMQQEGLTNVSVFQASALNLPFLDETFDLIVVNGVLEWVGEWSLDGEPRQIQLRFLKSLNRLLKPGGTLLIGIENRIGLSQLRGAQDHSGLRFTSLLPRRLASLVLRYHHANHHRTVLNSKREYRTYTYSARGYRKLLRESGFGTADFAWVEPGYNYPCGITPLRRALVTEEFRRQLRYAPRQPRTAWRRWTRRWLARVGFPNALVDEFLIFAGKEKDARLRPAEQFWSKLREIIPMLPQLSSPALSLVTHPFGRKNIVRVNAEDSSQPRIVLKASVPTEGSEKEILSEYHRLERVRALLCQQDNPLFSLPELLGQAHLGNTLYTAETAVPGREMTELILPPLARHALHELLPALSLCIDAATQIAGMFRGDDSMPMIPPSYWDLPEELRADARVRELCQAAGCDSGSMTRRYTDWAQHGDFVIYNLFLDRACGRLSVLDWERTARGLPPLFDVFSFLISILPAVPIHPIDSGQIEPHGLQFLEAFFGRGECARAYRALILRACSRLGIPADRVWQMFIHFLVLRLGSYLDRGPLQAPYYVDYLRLASQNADRFLFAAALPKKTFPLTASVSPS